MGIDDYKVCCDSIPEHTRVRVVEEICELDAVVPVGTVGTVVHVIRHGEGYDVEFPLGIIVSAYPWEIEVIHADS